MYNNIRRYKTLFAKTFYPANIYVGDNMHILQYLWTVTPILKHGV